jgi:hypothetical protein
MSRAEVKGWTGIRRITINMASQKQIDANRRNGANGGPKTPRGKAHARMNALKHGLQAGHVIIPGEDPEVFEALRLSLEEHLKPVGPVEDLLVERIAVERLRLIRATRFETGILHAACYESEKDWAYDEMVQNGSYEDIGADRRHASRREDVSKKGGKKTRNPEKLRAYEEAKKALDAAEEKLNQPLILFSDLFLRSAEDLEKLSRYETSISRRLRNAIQDLQAAQARRISAAAEAATVIEGTTMGRKEGAEACRQGGDVETGMVIEVQEVDRPESHQSPPVFETLKPETKSEGTEMDLLGYHQARRGPEASVPVAESEESEAPTGNRDAVKELAEFQRIRRVLAAYKRNKLKGMASSVGPDGEPAAANETGAS